jgi:hypothetical protein
MLVWLLFWAIGFEEQINIKSLLAEKITFSVLIGVLFYYHAKQERNLENKRSVNR